MNKLIYHPIFIGLVSLLAIIFIISLNKNNQKSKLSNQSISHIQTEIDMLKIQIDTQKEKLEAVKDPLSKEKILRDQLLLKKENEYVVQIPDIEVEEDENFSKNKISAWEEWKKLILNL